MTTLRPFLPSDYAAARSLWETTPGVGLSGADEPEAIEAFLMRNPGLSFVAVDGERLLGTILCGHDGRRGLIHHLATSPDCRRQGLASRLMQLSLQALGAVGIQKCHLMVFCDNEAGMAFWRAVGAKQRVELMLFSLDT